MPDLDAAEVMAANDAWVWLPPGCPTVQTAEYLLAFYPSYFTDPTQVLRTDSARAPDELAAEVVDHARERDKPRVLWWVNDMVRPSGLEQHLQSLGGVLDETLTVLAKRLDGSTPVNAGQLDIRPVSDRRTVEDNHRVGVAVFDEQMPGEEELQQELERLGEDDDDPKLTVVGYLDDQPVGIGGVTVTDGVARLWGGGTMPAARRRGVYAALLAARLSWAYEHGARFALTRGRVQTSAPLLRKVGFEAYGEGRSYRIEV